MRTHRLQLKPIALVFSSVFPLLSLSTTANADTTTSLPEVTISARKIDLTPDFASELLEKDRSTRRPSHSDTAQLLSEFPGIALSFAGGVSSLPVIHGLADDRNRIKIDGMDLISACGNHMNPPLSYIDPTNVESIRVYSGITPISAGGDSIGGAIVLTSKSARFAKAGEGLLSSGELGGFYRSNGDAHGLNVSAMLANENLNLSYTGSSAQSNNYKSAKEFKPGTTASWTTAGNHWIAGNEVGSTAYKTENQSLGIALRSDTQQVDFKASFQHIPYQGFPNQHMDMTDNKSTQLNLGYTGTFNWGSLQARIYNEDTRHKMDFAEDKLYWYGTTHNVAGMPMQTKGKNTGAQLKATIVLNEQDTLHLGSEYQRYRLNDWWAPVANSSMMSPNTFWNINNGQRDRFDIFSEWEARWSSQWLTVAGVRSSTVTMDSGTVQGYNTMAMMYGNDAARFNASNRQKTDRNIDASLLARYAVHDGLSYEGGYSRKTRSPSLYERYTWSSNGMAMTMNNWVNDGNGYVGDIELKPEVAHTISFTADWHEAAQHSWGLKITPYYSKVDNYINAKCLTTCTPNRFNYLKLVNHDAELYGIDLSGFANLGHSAGWGEWTVKGMVAYVKGKDMTTDDPLYNIMPLNAKLALEHQWGRWTNTLEEVLVSDKRETSQVRNEMRTAGYGLLNLRSSYNTPHYRFEIGIENVLNKQYALPLGGAYLGQGTTMSLNGSGAPYGVPVPGMGRSIYAGFSLKF